MASIDDMQTPPAVSVIIINYNAGHWLTDCIASTVDQVQEVIVIDNASADNSMLLAETAFAQDSRVGFTYFKHNHGFAKACNHGAARASKPYILFLNPDCLLQPNAVVALVSALRSDVAVGLVGGVLTDAAGVEQPGSRRQIPGVRQAFFNLLGLSRLCGDFNHHLQPLPQHPITIEANSGAMMLLSRDTFLQMQGFDEHYFMHCEDLDLCMRLRLHNQKILFVPQARAIHGQGICSRTRPIFVLWHKHKSMLYFYRKFYRSTHAWPLQALITLGIGVRLVMSVLRHALLWLLNKQPHKHVGQDVPAN